MAADSGVSQTALAGRIKAAVGKSADVVTGDQLTQETTNGIKNGLGFFSLILQIFGGIALVVGLFIIANTFAMLVGQRARELALLRAVGASRAQVVAIGARRRPGGRDRRLGRRPRARHRHRDRR